MDWNRTFKHFGEVEEGTQLEFTFVYYGDKTYKKHSTSCGCLSSARKGNELTVSFKADKVSDRTKQHGREYTKKAVNVTVEFTDGSKDVLGLEVISLTKDAISKELPTLV